MIESFPLRPTSRSNPSLVVTVMTEYTMRAHRKMSQASLWFEFGKKILSSKMALAWSGFVMAASPDPLRNLARDFLSPKEAFFASLVGELEPDPELPTSSTLSRLADRMFLLCLLSYSILSWSSSTASRSTTEALIMDLRTLCATTMGMVSERKPRAPGGLPGPSERQPS